MGVLDNTVIKITCPQCGKEIKKQLRWFKSHSAACPGCGVTFNTDQLRRVVNDVEKSLASIGGKSIKLRV